MSDTIPGDDGTGPAAYEDDEAGAAETSGSVPAPEEAADDQNADPRAEPAEAGVPESGEQVSVEQESGAPNADTRYEPAAPRPLGVPREPTGNADVDAGLGRLGDADHLATDGHIEVYEDVHRGLRDALTALDARQGPPAPAQSPTPRPDASPYRPSPSGTPMHDNRS